MNELGQCCTKEQQILTQSYCSHLTNNISCSIEALISGHLASITRNQPLKKERHNPPAKLLSKVSRAISLSAITMVSTRLANLLAASALTLDDQRVRCAICHEAYGAAFESETPIELPGCKHIFGAKCIPGWYQGGNNTCPFCRQPILATRITSQEQMRRVDSSSQESFLHSCFRVPFRILPLLYAVLFTVEGVSSYYLYMDQFEISLLISLVAIVILLYLWKMKL